MLSLALLALALHHAKPPPPAFTAQATTGEDQYPLLADGPFGVLRFDEGLRILQTNAPLDRLLGYAEAELCGTALPDLLWPPDVALAGVLAEVWNGHAPYCQIEQRLRSKHGEALWVRLVVTAGLHGPGGAPCYVALVEDLREAKEIEATLWRMSQRFATIFHSAPLAAAFLSLPDLTYKDVNRSFLDLTGYLRQEIVDTGVGELGILDREVLRAALEAVQDGQRVYEREHTVRARDGQIRSVLLSVARVHKHEAQDAIVMLTDLTEQKAAEVSLRASHQRYRMFVETISEAVWCFEFPDGIDAQDSLAAQFRAVFDQGRLVEWNDAFFVHLLGLPVQPSGCRIEALLTPTPALEHLYADFIRSGYQLKNHLYRDGGGEQPERAFLLNLVGIREGTRLVRLWGSAIDVTASFKLRKHMVTALEMQQQRIGRDLHDGVGQLLTSIRLLCEHLGSLAPSDTPGYAPLVAKIAALSEEAVEQTRGIYRGLVPPQIATQGLALSLEHLAATLEENADTKIHFDTDPEVDVWNSEAALHLYRIAQEACANALKYGQAANLYLSMAGDAHAITLRVEDDGVGFAPGQPGSNGFGLHSMRYRATLIGGTLDVASAAGQGTTVTCRLPRPPVRNRL